MSGVSGGSHGRSDDSKDRASLLFDSVFSSKSGASALNAKNTIGETSTHQSHLVSEISDCERVNNSDSHQRQKINDELDEAMDCGDSACTSQPSNYGTSFVESTFSAVEEGNQQDDMLECSPERLSPQPKRLRSDIEKISHDTTTTCANRFKTEPLRLKPAYKHSWLGSDEKEEEVDSDRSQIAFKIPSRGSESIQGNLPSDNHKQTFTSIRVNLNEVMSAKTHSVYFNPGDEQDYENDVDYVLSTLNDPEATVNLKCLSVISLARKCVDPEFRIYFRSRAFGMTLEALRDAPNFPNLALCVSAVIYMLVRDKGSLEVNVPTLQLFCRLLKVEDMVKNSDSAKYSGMVMDVLFRWLERSFPGIEGVQFDFTERTISSSSLMLESFVYMCGRRHYDQDLKKELLNMGVLQWLVCRVDQAAIQLINEHEVPSIVDVHLNILERCFRILESATTYNKKNQAYLVSHRGSILIQSCVNLIAFIFDKVEMLQSNDRNYSEKCMMTLNRIIGLLMNMSHENELCSNKLGEMNRFLYLASSCFTYLVPKFTPKEKQFDLTVLICSLLVNLIERCNSNRRRLLQLSVPLYHRETQNSSNESTLRALSLLFLHHESIAKSIDEELDNDLVLEEEVEEDAQEEGADNGRLNRMCPELSEDEMIETIQKAINKASTHMEDSVLASYFALLIGCLLQQNEEAVQVVKKEMKDGKLNLLIEQLQRFLEFMKISSNGRSSDKRFVERIIDLLDTLNDSVR